MLKITVVIPTFNRKKLLLNTLKQINQQMEFLLNIIDLSIVVVNDGSSDGTKSAVKKKFHDIHIVDGTGSWWYTKSINEGFKYALFLKPNYVLALNDDVVLEDNYFLHILEAAKKTEDKSIIGSFSYIKLSPPKVFFSGVKHINKITFKRLQYIKKYSKVNLSEIHGYYKTKTLPGRGMLIPVSVLKELNFFDESFPQYGSDDDFILRANKKGFSSYISFDARIISLPQFSSQGSPINSKSFFSFLKEMFTNKYSSFYFLKDLKMVFRHGSKWTIPLTIVFVFIRSIISYMKNNNKVNY